MRFAPGSPRAARAGSRAGAPRAAKGTAPICDRQKAVRTPGPGERKEESTAKMEGRVENEVIFQC